MVDSIAAFALGAVNKKEDSGYKVSGCRNANIYPHFSFPVPPIEFNLVAKG